MRWFLSPEKFIKYYLDKKGGSIRTDDGGWIVNQSDEFYRYCYTEGYQCWKKSNNIKNYELRKEYRDL